MHDAVVLGLALVLLLGLDALGGTAWLSAPAGFSPPEPGTLVPAVFIAWIVCRERLIAIDYEQT